MKVLVTGGRTFLDTNWLFAGLDLLHSSLPGGITEIIEGEAPGADIRARFWAERHGVKVVGVKAQWDKFGKSAGFRRNAEMADLKPDVVLACPGGKGTRMMVDLAKTRGLKVVYLEKMPVVRSERDRNDTSVPLLA